MLDDDDKSIGDFLAPNIPDDLKHKAVKFLLGLTASEEGLQYLSENSEYMKLLVPMISEHKKPYNKSVLKFFVNITSCEEFSVFLASLQEPDFLSSLFTSIITTHPLANFIVVIMSNLTGFTESRKHIYKKMQNLKIGVDYFVRILCSDAASKKDMDMNYFGPVLCNLTNIPDIRKSLLEQEASLLKKILPFSTDLTSQERRSGIIGVLRNCCFDTEFHDLLLRDDTGFLSSLLLPLMGPEEYSDEDNDKFPLDLQYLSEDKEREPIARNRKMLVEALIQLCATANGRKVLNEKGVYVIIRELHKTETSSHVNISIENLITILIGDEPPKEMENLRDVEVPDDLTEKFVQEDESMLAEAENENPKEV